MINKMVNAIKDLFDNFLSENREFDTSSIHLRFDLEKTGEEVKVTYYLYDEDWGEKSSKCQLEGSLDIDEVEENLQDQYVNLRNKIRQEKRSRKIRRYF
jgi:hypothetical protein